MTNITIYVKAETTSKNFTAIVPTNAATSLVRFSTGQAAFNWARKMDAHNVTVIVKSTQRGHYDEPMTIAKDSEGDYLNGIPSSQWGRIVL